MEAVGVHCKVLCIIWINFILWSVQCKITGLYACVCRKCGTVGLCSAVFKDKVKVTDRTQENWNSRMEARVFGRRRITGLICVNVTILGTKRQRATGHLFWILEQRRHKTQLHKVKQYYFLKIRNVCVNKSQVDLYVLTQSHTPLVLSVYSRPKYVAVNER